MLNCEDFHWAEYTAGADIVLTDPYPIADNMTFSKQYGTACNATYGCCGCDNCECVCCHAFLLRDAHTHTGAEARWRTSATG